MNVLYKEVLGFYLSDHPLRGFESLAKMWVTSTVSELPLVYQHHQETLGQQNESAEKKTKSKDWRAERDAHKKRVIVAGLIAELRELITKKGTRMAFGKIEDLTAACEVVIFPDAFAKFEMSLKDERPVLLAGLLEVEEGNAKIIVDNISPLEEMLKKSKKVIMQIDQLQNHQFEQLRGIIQEHLGQVPIQFEMSLPEYERKVTIDTEENLSIEISNNFFESVHSLFGQTDFIELRG